MEPLILSGGCGAVCIIYIAKYLLEHVRLEKVWNIGKWLGRNSLIILCLHLIELDLIPWDKVMNFVGINEQWFIPTLILKFIWAVGGTWIISHTRLRLIFNV